MILKTFAACLLLLTGCLENNAFHPERRQLLAELVPHLKTYTVYDQNGPLLLKRVGRDYDGGYIVPEKSLQMADALLGYGIADDPSFEEAFSDTYKRPSYGFDGGVASVPSKNKLFTFFRECISSDQFLYGNQMSSGKVSTFTQQLDRLGLKGKKVFVKMDIEGAEYEAFPDILAHADQITGIAFELHFRSLPALRKAVALLKELDQQFILVHVHGNNSGKTFSTKGMTGKIPYTLELTYINKNLVTRFEVALNQKHPQPIDRPNVPTLPEAEFEIID